MKANLWTPALSIDCMRMQIMDNDIQIEDFQRAVAVRQPTAASDTVRHPTRATTDSRAELAQSVEVESQRRREILWVCC